MKEINTFSVSRKKKGGRGLSSIEECVNVTIYRLGIYKKSKERLVTAISNE